MGIDWIPLIPSIVFTKMKSKFPKDIKAKYDMTDKNFSSAPVSNTPPTFPFVSFETYPFSENGKDLERTEVNCGNFVFQIEVTAKESIQGKTISKAILKIMKRMGFDVNEFPLNPVIQSGTYRYIARYSRNLSENDVL